MALHKNHKKSTKKRMAMMAGKAQAKMKRLPRGSGTFSAADIRRGFRVC